MSQNKHWGIHLISAVVISVLLVIMFQPTQLEEKQSTIIKEMQLKQEILRTQNDSLESTAEALAKQLSTPDPQPEIKIKYIERDEAINNIQEVDVPDSVLAILKRRRAARLERVND